MRNKGPEAEKNTETYSGRHGGIGSNKKLHYTYTSNAAERDQHYTPHIHSLREIDITHLTYTG